jgi:hypothetical protein
MTSNLSKFNEQILNFLQEMSSLFPEDKNLSKVYHAAELMKSLNPREIMNQFRDYVMPFKKQILSKDESFFIQSEFTDKVVDQSSIAEMMRIKHIWNSDRLTVHDKECIWNYFKVFLYLIDKEYKN